MKRTYIDGETAIKPYYYLRNGALHVRFASDRCIQLSKNEEKRLKNEMTEKPYNKQEILECAWKFYADCVKKTVIQDGIAYADKLIERLKMKREIESVLFDEEKHEYYYKGLRLYGITGAIAKLLGKFFPENDACMLARMYGTAVHTEVENYFNNGKELSTESGKWIIENINEFIKINNIKVKDVKSEVMVSDFEGTASKIDIVLTSLDGNAYLFDIKTGNFDRPYCSLQLSCYKYLFELCYNIKVCGLYVLHTKTKKRFHIIEQNQEKVLKLLEMNKGK